MRLLRAGEEAVLIEVADLDAALALFMALSTEPPEGVVELVPAARTVLLRLAPGRTTPERLAAELRERDLGSAARTEGELVELPVVYDGEDLEEVARLAGLSTAEVVARHSGREYAVAFTGFAPGFAYLSGGDPALRVPRLETPRTAIPAGAVAVAGEFSGVYPRPSPGGWRLLGRTEVPLFDLRREPPALLRPGARVRFVPVVAHTGKAASSHPHDAGETRRAPAASGVAGGRRGALEVVEAGGQVLVQDLGRPGRAELGVSPSGAMDRAALRRANRMVGNPPETPALEVLLVGAGRLTIRAHRDVIVAVAGAEAPVRIAERAVARDRPLWLPGGAELALEAPDRGAYAYLAVRGGLAAEPVIGSASRDVLARLGPEPLRPGDLLPIGDMARAAVLPGEPGPRLPAPGEAVVLDVVPGPRENWFGPGALDLLTGQDWEVTASSNRIGLRLSGEQPLGKAVQEELPSEATVRGALQVPPDGQPVLFAADHPLTGGYPVLACVAARHLGLAGQLPVGAVVRFRLREPSASLPAPSR